MGGRIQLRSSRAAKRSSSFAGTIRSRFQENRRSLIAITLGATNGAEVGAVKRFGLIHTIISSRPLIWAARLRRIYMRSATAMTRRYPSSLKELWRMELIG